MENKDTSNIVYLVDLVDTRIPNSVCEEVKYILSLMFESPDTTRFESIFTNIVHLFNGEYEGYQKCTTDYHDLTHTLDALLAMARLIHGYSIANNQLSEKSVHLGLVSTLMHDTGYIQSADDTTGTGAKYTLIHISRSIAFMEKYFKDNGYGKSDFDFCSNCIWCTNISEDVTGFPFSSREEEIVGKMLGITDLMGQMADRNYLEKLILLYIEFEEGKVQGFNSELDLLEKTIGFFNFTKKRFSEYLGNLDKYMIYHFIERWNIHEDLYTRAFNKNAEYLEYIIANNPETYHTFLRRDGILDELHR